MSEDIRDIYFLNWYKKKDFTLLEQMKDEFHREYYCRSAWFARDEEIENLQKQNSGLKALLEKAISEKVGLGFYGNYNNWKRSNKKIFSRINAVDMELHKDFESKEGFYYKDPEVGGKKARTTLKEINEAMERMG